MKEEHLEVTHVENLESKDLRTTILEKLTLLLDCAIYDSKEDSYPEKVDEYGYSPPADFSPLRGKRVISIEMADGKLTYTIRRSKCSRKDPKIIGDSVFTQTFDLKDIK